MTERPVLNKHLDSKTLPIAVIFLQTTKENPQKKPLSVGNTKSSCKATIVMKGQILLHWTDNFKFIGKLLEREIELGGIPTMKLKNILIVVKNIEKSKQFYHDLFDLDMVLDNEGNMILTEGLVLQDEKIWKKFLGKDIIPKSNSCELYFEEQDIEAFIEKLENTYPSIQYVNRLMTHSWGQKVIRFYDLDGNLIEVGSPM